MPASRPAPRRKLPFTRKELCDSRLPRYTGESLRMISFPLGGIGTGTIGLGGRGELRDWEIFNNPNLGYRPPYTMPYIFCKQGRSTDARVLERRLLPPHHAGHGLPPDQFCGLPRLAEAVFFGSYPVARVFFSDKDLPVSVELEAFNPMIPGDADDSAIPAAILIYRLTNRTRRGVSGSIAISMSNTVGLSGPDGLGQNVNAFEEANGFRGIRMTGGKYPAGTIGCGSEALVTTARRVSYATDFDEPGWLDRAQKVWDDYSADGRLEGPTQATAPSEDKKTRIGMLAAEYNLRPGASAEIVFLITWSFPHRVAQWHLEKHYQEKGQAPPTVRNHYAGRFGDAWAAAEYVTANLDRLRSATMAFERTLIESTLPGCVIDAVSSQMSIIRTNTTMWLDTPADEPAGRVFAFEGCNLTSGCCPMNCTHVWNYEQALAHLYPSLERTMRLTDYEDDLHDEGAMSFRTNIPLKMHLPVWNPKTPAADGQFGTVVKVHREWRISGDDAYLRRLWPGVRQSIEFAWKGFARWDADKDGVMEGIQHNTYDINFHGPNTMCGTLYLAALAAGVEMAKAVGDDAAAAEFAQVYASGSARCDCMLFNGEFYEQKVAEADADYVDLIGNTIKAGRPKYQYGCGCLSDQLLGQWAAHVAGLGYVLPEGHVKKALAAVFRHNFKADLSRHQSVQRTYALNDEAALVLCTWPNGKREKFPFPYCDEAWTGIEYQVAAHLIYEGLLDEGLSVVKAVRDRHDGQVRNPWNEFECGDHYARAMSSWSLLLALAGQYYDGRSAALTVRPRINQRSFRCIFTTNDAYGTFSQALSKACFIVRLSCGSGQVALGRLHLSWPTERPPEALRAEIRLNGRKVQGSAAIREGRIDLALASKATLVPGDALEIVLRSPRKGDVE